MPIKTRVVKKVDLDKLEAIIVEAEQINEIDGFVNTNNPNIKLSYGKTTKALTKAFDAATHTIAVKIGGIHDVALDGTMKVILKEGGTNLTRELLISGHWDGYSATKQWTAGSVREITAQSTPLECKFAKDATSIYVILGAIEARGTLKVAISNVMTNFIDANPMTMEIVSLANLTGLTVDLTKSDNLVGIASSASEIDGIVVKNKKDFSAIEPSQSRTSMVAYTSTGALQLTAKLDSGNDIYFVISKNGVNNITTLYNIKSKINALADPLPPSSGSYTNVQTASTDTVCAPYNVKAVNNGDDGTVKFTGGWHGQNGDLTGLPTAKFVGYTFVVDGIDRTSENNVVRSGVKKVEYTVTHNIMGYNTYTSSRYVLQEKMKYTIIEGIIQFDMEITALEDCIIERYYGLQTQANSTAWNQTTLFKNGEYGRLNFSADINSGNKYSGVSTLTSQKGTYELETWIDNTYGLGQRKQVADLTPSVFGILSTMKIYQNLVNGIPLTLLAGEKAYWRGGWRVRNLDINRL